MAEKNHWFQERGTVRISVFFSFISILAAVALAGGLAAKAEGIFIQETIPAERLAAYSVSSTDGRLIFSVAKGTSTEALFFQLYTKLMKAEIRDSGLNYDDGLTPASDLYSLTIATTSQEVIADFDPEIVFQCPADNGLYNIYLWDKLSDSFVKISSRKDLKKRLAALPVKDYGELIFALFEEGAAEGRASWYVHPRYRKELMAASTQFPRGAKVKVTNLANSKSVVVTIKDWGPDPVKHPDRVIDLNKVAFQKIASVRAGVINVRVEPIIESTSTVAIKK